MQKSDIIRIQHMLDAARETLSFANERTRSDLNIDRQLTLSLIKSIEIIGEAAVNVTKRFREKYPQIPWQDIRAMRNRLIHVYFDIDLDRVWDTVAVDLPPLVAELEKVIASEEAK